MLPQLLLCGLFVARDQMAGWLEAISAVLPLTYAYDALDRATSAGRPGRALRRWTWPWWPGSRSLALALGAATLRRRTA